MTVIFDAETIKLVALFSELAGVRVRDCVRFPPGSQTARQLLFILEPGEQQKIKPGARQRLQKLLSKQLKIIEYTPLLEAFVRAIVAPARLASFKNKEGDLILEAADLRSRGLLIGAVGQNLKGFEAILKRHFDIKSIRVS